MQQYLEVKNEKGKLIANLEINECSLIIPPNMTIEDWETVGLRLGELNKRMQWWIGDWLNFGEAQYGEKYSQAMDATELDYGSLRNIASVARKFPPKYRNPNVTFSHHAVLTTLELDDAKNVLKKIEEHGLTVKETREILKKNGIKTSIEQERTVDGAGTCCHCHSPLNVHVIQVKHEGEWVTKSVQTINPRVE